MSVGSPDLGVWCGDSRPFVDLGKPSVESSVDEICGQTSQGFFEIVD